MAIPVSDQRQAQAGPGAMPEPFRALARLLGAIWSIASVRRVALSTDGGSLELWVFLREEVLEDQERIFLHLRAYRATPGVSPLDLHIIPLSEIDPSILPPVETLFERDG